MRKTRFAISGAGKPGHPRAATVAATLDCQLAGVVWRTSHSHRPWTKGPAVIPVSEHGAVDAALVQDCTLDAAFLDRDTRGFVAGALQGTLRLAAEKKWMQGMFVRIERSTT